MDCINDPDFSIRLQALELCAGIVSSDNLVAIVELLMQQLRNTPSANRISDDDRIHALLVEPAADPDREDPESALGSLAEQQDNTPTLPAEYSSAVIHRILGMCSKDTYANVLDFEWYIDVLVQLVRLIPASSEVRLRIQRSNDVHPSSMHFSKEKEAASAIGWELRNVAVRVSVVRPKAVKAARHLMAAYCDDAPFASIDIKSDGPLAFASWIVGEYVDCATFPDDILDYFLHVRVRTLSPVTLHAYLHAAAKVLTSIITHKVSDWSSERQATVSLLIAKLIDFLEPLTSHPYLEVQERSVEILELMRLASQAVVGHGVENDHGPLLLSHAIPELFNSFEIKPVAPSAQRQVPVPDDLDLGAYINQDLPGLLYCADEDSPLGVVAAEFETFYNLRPEHKVKDRPAFDSLPSMAAVTTIYQQAETLPTDVDVEAALRKRNERRERNKDDPFYIGSDDHASDTWIPLHNTLRNAHGLEVDVDSIPIMDLYLDEGDNPSHMYGVESKQQKRKRPSKFQILEDETIEQKVSGSTSNDQICSLEVTEASSHNLRTHDRVKRSLLQVDSSGLSRLSIESALHGVAEHHDDNLEIRQDAEMAQAVAEVERQRLEMQRASERTKVTGGTPSEGILVKKKRKNNRPKTQFKEDASLEVRDSECESPSHLRDKKTASGMRKKKKKKKNKNSSKSISVAKLLAKGE